MQFKAVKTNWNVLWLNQTNFNQVKKNKQGHIFLGQIFFLFKRTLFMQKPKIMVRFGKEMVQIWGALPELYLKVMFFASF